MMLGVKTGSTTRNAGASRDRLRRVEGRHNPLVKELRRAFAQSELTEDGHCAIEGMRILEEAIRSGLRFRAVFFSDSSQARAERILPQLGQKVEAVLLPDSIFASLAPTEAPQGVAALVRCRKFEFPFLLERAALAPLVGVAGVQDPGNLGTILRSAEAFEAGGVILGEGTVSPFNSKVVRASAGSVFRLPMVNGGLAALLGPLREAGLRLVATSSHNGTRLDQANLSNPIAIFIGNEGAGMPKDLLAQMDETIAIPHSSKVESLNAGVAASIVLYEAARQRAAAPAGADRG